MTSFGNIGILYTNIRYIERDSFYNNAFNNNGLHEKPQLHFMHTRRCCLAMFSCPPTKHFCLIYMVMASRAHIRHLYSCTIDSDNASFCSFNKLIIHNGISLGTIRQNISNHQNSQIQILFNKFSRNVFLFQQEISIE